jgi:hypothetical protein
VSHNAASPAPRSDLLDSLDDSKTSRFQIKIMFVSGMGFFTDAYDLFVIGIGLPADQPVKPQHQPGFAAELDHPGRLRGRRPGLRARGRHPRA